MTLLAPAFQSCPLAHRGHHDKARGVPEYLRAAFEATIGRAHGTELDVQLSRDEHAIVFHGYHIDRMTPVSGSLGRRRRAELRYIGLPGGRENIPDLDEILGLVAGRVPVPFQIQDRDSAMMRDVGPPERDTARAIVGFAGMSFNPFAVETFSQAAPDTPRDLARRACLTAHNQPPCAKPALK